MADRTSPPQDPLDPLIGSTVGNWRLERKIGQGGMGGVYFLRHVRLRNNVAAMKVLRVADAREAARLRARFDQEALVADAIGSHRVVKPLDMGELPDGTPYFIMEYVEGRSLQHELAAVGPLSVEAALLIVFRIADTMGLAHDKGIVHRDLKPANIMLAGEVGTAELQVKLLDFGVARATGEIKLAETTDRMVIGTPGYMSPEAVTGAATDGRADVFSLGVVLFEMLTGRLPFPAPTVAAAFTNVLGEPPLPLVAHRPAHLDPVPADVLAVVERCLSKDASRRGTMRDVERAAGGCLTRMGALRSARAAAAAGSLFERMGQQVAEEPTQTKAPPRPVPAPPPSAATLEAAARPTVVTPVPSQPSRRRRLAMFLLLFLGAAGGGLFALLGAFHRGGAVPPSEPAEAAAPPDLAIPPDLASTAPDLAPEASPDLLPALPKGKKGHRPLRPAPEPPSIQKGSEAPLNFHP